MALLNKHTKNRQAGLPASAGRPAQAGLTLMELLIVVFVVGSLTGVMLRVVNSNRQRAVATDSVRRANITKLADAIESYYTAERSYPGQGIDAGPLDGPDGQTAGIYLSQWPGADYEYVYDDTLKEFAVYVVKSTDSTRIFKYSSIWQKLQDCPVASIDVDDC